MGIMHILCEAGYGSAYNVFAGMGYMRRRYIETAPNHERRPLEVNRLP